MLCGLRFGPGVGHCTPCFPAQSHPINSRGRWDARGQLCLFGDFRRTIKLSRWLLVVVLFGFVILSGGEREGQRQAGFVEPSKGCDFPMGIWAAGDAMRERGGNEARKLNAIIQLALSPGNYRTFLDL